MAHQIGRSFFDTYLRKPADARALAQEVADRTGQEVAVTDEAGNVVCIVTPTPPPRRNEIMVRSKS